MVTFEDIRLNVDIQIQLAGYIWDGKIMWKGKLVGKPGNWVGLQLKDKVGHNNGSFHGKQYFKCPHGYGVFSRASNLRFLPSKGRSSSAYRTVSKESFIDDTLFGSRKATRDEEVKKSIKVPTFYARSASNIFREKTEINDRKTFHLGHPVGGRIVLDKASSPFSFKPKALANQPSSSREQNQFLKRSVSTSLVLMSSRDIEQPFFSAPSIPSTRNMQGASILS